AHDGAMESGTIGCAAGGVDVFYPPENEARQKRMFEVGLVVSERPLGLEPRANDFPRRNRIIAGLSQACVVVEAAPRSGSLITARMAAEAGREVMAVPGSPLDPRAQGCNQLIRDGATLIQNVADVMEGLRPAGRVASPGERYEAEVAPVDASSDVRSRVVELLGPSPAPVDEIVRLSGASPGEVQLVLLELDLGGRLDRHAGGKVSLTA
ncbi:MAG TPA: DNA-processing protein DprA, partial [Sphingomicrobium sp.]|nr:DNA-processing protein DprA [Sphingomicrobium sp.]